MYKLFSWFKLVYLIPVLVFALFLDLVVFAAANSCTACASFGQYLQSAYSLANATFLSITAILINKKR